MIPRLAVNRRATFTALLSAGAVLAPIAIQAQLNVTCRPPKESNEAKLLAFYAMPIAFSPGGMVAPLSSGQVRISFDAAYVPSPSRAMQQPQYCYGREKRENTELSKVFPRPRITIGLPGRVMLEGSYLPPIKVNDAEPNMGSIAISRPWTISGSEEKGSLSLSLRAHATFGRVRGAITCPKKALQLSDAAVACYGTSESDDTYKPNMFGGELALSKVGAENRWGAYALTGVTLLRPRFQVGFQYQDAPFDDTKISVDLTRFAAGGGLWYRLVGAAAITGELYSVPTDATTFRLGGAYTFR